jgi:thiamine biosynthesis lipoprotein
MRSFRFAAMGSEAHVLLPSDRGDAITPVRELFADWEARLSRFLPDSELSRLNTRAGEPVVVGRLLFDAIWTAVAAARATDGIFDPTLLPQLRRIGYAESFDRMSESVAAVDAAPAAGGDWRNIVLDRRSRTVVLPPGCALDLGGIAKGMVADAALDSVKARGVGAALVSAGGDLCVFGLPPAARAWQVLVGDDSTGDVVPLVRGALATSGSTRRAWLQGGGIARHHLLDPRTGEPAASGLSEVTVAASTCEAAEVAATVAFALGPRLGAEFLSARRLAGRLTHEDGTISTVGPWPRRVSTAA